MYLRSYTVIAEKLSLIEHLLQNTREALFAGKSQQYPVTFTDNYGRFIVSVAVAKDAVVNHVTYRSCSSCFVVKPQVGD